MKILIVTQYFWPEEFRINDLAIELSKRGNEVSVLTGNPNYPKGRFYEGYGLKYSKEYYNGIKIYRMPILPRRKSLVALVFNYISFVLSGSIFSLLHRQKYDKIIALNYSPITAVFPAIIFKKLHKTPLILWVQDLWPESVRAASNVKSGLIDKVLFSMARTIFKNSDKILLSSSGFFEPVVQKGADQQKISYLPNWAEDLFGDPMCIDKERYRSLIPDDSFIVMFAGNIGEAQDFESIIEAASLTKHIRTINWIIIGEGRKKEWLINELENKNLTGTVKVLGSYPLTEMPSFFFHADLMLATLKDEYIFSLTVPGKIQSYMAFGKPVVIMLSGEGSKIITEANCGFAANSSDFKKLAENIIHASQLQSHELEELGRNGRKYYDMNFAKDKAIDKLLAIMEQAYFK
jgi:glycosyltransferase involved in cell wall biosynthesis